MNQIKFYFLLTVMLNSTSIYGYENKEQNNFVIIEPYLEEFKQVNVSGELYYIPKSDELNVCGDIDVAENIFILNSLESSHNYTIELKHDDFHNSLWKEMFTFDYDAITNKAAQGDHESRFLASGFLILEHPILIYADDSLAFFRDKFDERKYQIIQNFDKYWLYLAVTFHKNPLKEFDIAPDDESKFCQIKKHTEIPKFIGRYKELNLKNLDLEE